MHLIRKNKHYRRNNVNRNRRAPNPNLITWVEFARNTWHLEHISSRKPMDQQQVLQSHSDTKDRNSISFTQNFPGFVHLFPHFLHVLGENGI